MLLKDVFPSLSVPDARSEFRQLQHFSTKAHFSFCGWKGRFRQCSLVVTRGLHRWDPSALGVRT